MSIGMTFWVNYNASQTFSVTKETADCQITTSKRVDQRLKSVQI